MWIKSPDFLPQRPPVITLGQHHKAAQSRPGEQYTSIRWPRAAQCAAPTIQSKSIDPRQSPIQNKTKQQLRRRTSRRGTGQTPTLQKPRFIPGRYSRNLCWSTQFVLTTLLCQFPQTLVTMTNGQIIITLPSRRRQFNVPVVVYIPCTFGSSLMPMRKLNPQRLKQLTRTRRQGQKDRHPCCQKYF